MISGIFFPKNHLRFYKLVCSLFAFRQFLGDLRMQKTNFVFSIYARSVLNLNVGHFGHGRFGQLNM